MLYALVHNDGSLRPRHSRLSGEMKAGRGERMQLALPCYPFIIHN